MLTFRLIGPQDYRVSEDGQRIGRIRYASERNPGIWLWQIHVHIPGSPFGARRPSTTPSGTSRRHGWRHGPEKLAKA